MIEPTRSVRGLTVPSFMYGTAWKEESTEACVAKALDAGFRAIDTANQRKHYYEEGVGRALASTPIPRTSLFLQTKFTYRRGQDHRLPYDPAAPLSEQVRQSFESSLRHLGVDALDSYVLHGPARHPGWSSEDTEVWHAMEALHGAGRVRLLGVSNVDPGQLESLCLEARVRPAFVQNRCYASMGWDARVRRICAEQDIVYQGFSLLTANRDALQSPAVHDLARAMGRTVPQLVFRFAMQLGMLPLTGTTREAHMREDLEVYDFELDESAMQTLARAR